MGVSALELRRRVLMEAPHRVIESGASVSFETYVRQKLPVTVAINPVQAGTGDPSTENVRPVTGWTECEVTVANGDDPTATGYEDEEYTVEFPTETGTVYGGTLTINRDGTGVLSVFYLEKVLNGSETWQRVSSSTAGASYFRTKIGEYGYVVNGDALCDQFVTTPISTSTTTIGINCANSASANAAHISFRPGIPGVTNNDALKAWLQENNVQVVYRLSTPIVYNLTELQVMEALQGENVVSANTGDVTVEFWTN